MKKSNDTLNILKDSRVYEYVAGDQSEAAKSQFDDALKQNSGLKHDVDVERALRNAIKDTQPVSTVSEGNIDALFDLIDQEETQEYDTTAALNNESKLSPQKNVIGFAIAASLFLAVFLSINLNNTSSQLEPEFITLTSSPEATQPINFDQLVKEKRVVTLVLSDDVSAEKVAEIMNSHQLQQLNQQSLNANVVIAYTRQTINQSTLSNLETDALIQSAEVLKF